MKKILTLVTLTLLMTACGGGSDSSDPRAVALAFNKAMSSGDISKAKEYCTSETSTALDMIGGMMAMMPDSVREAGKNREFKVIRDSVVEDRAWVWIQDIDAEDGGEEATELKMEDGEWKVVFSKN